MLIYHKTNNKIYCTQVILGLKNEITTGTFVWDKHKEQVNELENNGDVFVTGATHFGAVYEGEYISRERYIDLIKDTKWLTNISKKISVN